MRAMTHEKAKSSRVPFSARMMNPIVKSLLRMGVPMPPTILLTVLGRKSGKPHTTPVGLFELDGRRYLFSTFGESNWVHNLRKSGEATLRRGRRREAVVAVELTPEEAARVLKGAMTPYFEKRLMARQLRSYYHVTPDSLPNEWNDAAKHHPVFEVQESLDNRSKLPRLAVRN